MVGSDNGYDKQMGNCHNTAARHHLCKHGKTPCVHPPPVPECLLPPTWQTETDRKWQSVQCQPSQTRDTVVVVVVLVVVVSYNSNGSSNSSKNNNGGGGGGGDSWCKKTKSLSYPPPNQERKISNQFLPSNS